MTEGRAADGRLGELQRRWQEEKAPQLLLQLAEEYRRQNRAGEAVAVLEEGLRIHPQHVSAQVALGRHRLEAGDAAAARGALERVVARDPSHLVARKLLVEASLELGAPEDARMHLDAYSSLNEGDPEIDLLDARIRREVAASAPPAEAPAPPAPDFASEDETSVEFGAVRSEPFPGLDRAEDRRRYLEGLASGILAAGVASTVYERQEPAVAQAPAAWPADVEPSPTAPDWGAAAEPPWEAAAEPPSEAPAEPETATLAGSPASPTATLGHLYLAQGHYDEAEGVFHDVLEREPASVAARLGLAEARRRRREAPLEAAALLGDLAEEELADMGVSRRKVVLLRRYLSRLRAGEPRVR